MNVVGQDDIDVGDVEAHEGAVAIGRGAKAEVHYHIHQDAPTVAVLAPGEQLRLDRQIKALIYRADRSEQERDIRVLLKEHANEGMPPLTCVLYGDSRQGHHQFLDRLKEVSLRKYLELDESVGITKLPLNWPASLSTLDSLPDRLQERLAETLSIDADASEEEIRREISSFPGPLIIHTLLDDSIWQQHGSECLHAYMRFWHKWHPLPGSHVLVCLMIAYELTDELQQKPGLFKRLFGGGKSVDVAAEIETALAPYRNDFTDFHPLTGRALCKLDSLSELETINWWRLEEVQTYLRMQQLMDDDAQGIKKLYSRWQEEHALDSVPMEPLAVELRQLLLGQNPLEA